MSTKKQREERRAQIEKDLALDLPEGHKEHPIPKPITHHAVLERTTFNNPKPIHYEFPANAFRTQFNLRRTGYPGTRDEYNNLPSLTVPEQSMSIREIMTRYANGLPVSAIQRVPVYHGEELLPDPRTLDLVDLQELKERNLEEIKKIQNDLQKEHELKQYDADLRKAEALVKYDQERKARRDAARKPAPDPKPDPKPE